jgi:hypothetical protein
VPTRKQRRRRRKSFRHEYEYVLVDEEGKEVESEAGDLAPTTTAAKAADKDAKKGTTKDSGKKGRASAWTSTRAGRVIQPPSWRRVGRRGLIFAPLMFVAISVLDHDQPLAFYAVQTVVLLAFFLPFNYVMDSLAYRMYLKRSGATPATPDAKRPAAKRQSAPRSPR